MSTPAFMESVQAEKLLAGSYLLAQIEELRNALQYTTDHQAVSYDDYYFSMEQEIGKVPHMVLPKSIAPGTEAQLQIQLVTALEKVYDDIERITSRLIHFQSKLKVAESRAKELRAAFVAWYSLALTEHLKTYDMSLPSKTTANLGEAEFERLTGGVLVEVTTLIEAVKVQLDALGRRRKTAQDKFNYGKDQVNAAWTRTMVPEANGVSSDDGARNLLEQDEETPQLPEESSFNGPQIVGKFRKTITSGPVTIVGETPPPEEEV